MAKQRHGCSVIATQLPIECTKRQLEEEFSVIGPVKRCHLVRDKDHVFKGIAYVVYSGRNDAVEAVNKLNNATVYGKIIKVKLTRERDNDGNNSSVAIKREGDEEGQGSQEKKNKRRRRADAADKNRKRRKNRNGRIVIRNLSFQVDEKAIQDHFSEFGAVTEVSVLRKSNGKLVGCAFVQYKTKREALYAIKMCNMKPLLGRTIAVDLAVPKEKFTTAKIKTEDTESKESIEIKEEHSLENTDEVMLPENTKIKEEDLKSESDDSGLEEESDSENEEKPNVESKRPLSDGPSRDVAEERTLFIKNLSYEATEQDITEVLEKYGTIKYVLLCIDRLTQHPRGTAFAQFVEREAADMCLEAEKDPSTKHLFTLHGRPMHIMRAISRKELQDRKNEEEKAMPKDKRNLYLAREGFVREGTLAAEGVSKADMALRIKREQIKRRMLKNLHMFVSPTRMCVNNLPKSVTDSELRKIFKTHAPKGAILTESRIMKNLQILDEDGKPVSRGYGFVSFTKHEDALAALRKVNNNPDIFTNDQRPIVEFSLENLTVLNARQKRSEKSKEKNPLWKKKNPSVSKEGNLSKQSRKCDDEEDESHVTFMGSKSNPSKRDLPTNFGPKVRHDKKQHSAGKISRKQLRKEQRDRALGKKRKRPQNFEEGMESEPVQKMEDTQKQPKKKKKKIFTKRMKSELRDEKSFNVLVQNYKKKMLSAESVSGKKWHED